jgi:hypothetical protein
MNFLKLKTVKIINMLSLFRYFFIYFNAVFLNLCVGAHYCAVWHFQVCRKTLKTLQFARFLKN